MTKNKKQRKILLLLILILGLTVGFALLSTTLKINGTAAIKSNTWDIHWDGESITETTGSVTAATPATIVENTDNQEIAFAVNFDLPGDYYEFTVDAVNAGTIDGILKQFEMGVYTADGKTKLKPTDEGYPTNLIYTVKYADDTNPTVDTDILAKATTSGTTTTPTAKKYKVRVEFDPKATTLPDTAVSYMFKLNVNYEQHK